MLAVPADLRLTVFDHEEVVRVVALLDQPLAF